MKFIRGIVLAMFLVIHVNGNAQIAIIVNNDNSEEELSMDRLKSIYLGKSTFFEDDTPIQLCEFEEDKEEFYKKVFGFTANRMSQYWFKEVFSGAATKPPKSFKTSKELLSYVAEHERAIAFIDVAKIGSQATVKVLKINHASPTEKGYLLGGIK